MRCFECKRELEVGDRFIADTASGFIGREGGSDVDDLIADLFGGSGGKVVLCEDCTAPGGDYMLETVYGDEEVGG